MKLQTGHFVLLAEAVCASTAPNVFASARAVTSTAVGLTGGHPDLWLSGSQKNNAHAGAAVAGLYARCCAVPANAGRQAGHGTAHGGLLLAPIFQTSASPLTWPRIPPLAYQLYYKSKRQFIGQLDTKLGLRVVQADVASACGALPCAFSGALRRTRPPALLDDLCLRRQQHSHLQQRQHGPAFLRHLSGGSAADGRDDNPTPSPPGPPSTAAIATVTTNAPDAVYNLPNAVSAARLLSGPLIGLWLLQGHFEAATIALAVSGASDWLDGFLARRTGTSSVFGSYLDPLADKVLIGCVAGALLAAGAMPLWLAAVVVGRDVALVGGALAIRLQGFGWRWPGREAFFRTAEVLPTAAAPTQPPSGGVSFMRPLLVSKANTVLQLVLLGSYLTRGIYGWPEGDPVAALELATAATTVLSLAAYGRMALQGKLFK